MANLFLPIPSLAGNGAGTPVDVSAMGASKTIVVSGSWTLDPTINIEINNDLLQRGTWSPLETLQGAGMKVVNVACRWMRTRVVNFRGGIAPVVNVGGPMTGTSFAELVAPPGNGNGAAVDISTLGVFKTVTVGDEFRGALIIEVSTDGSTQWAQVLSVSRPGQVTFVAASKWARARRVGVPVLSPGLPIINIGAADAPGGGGGGGWPADLYQSYTYVPTYAGIKVTKEEWFRLDLTLIQSVDYTYVGIKVATAVKKAFAPDGVTVIAQMTYVYSYAGIKVVQIDATRDI